MQTKQVEIARHIGNTVGGACALTLAEAATPAGLVADDGSGQDVL
jgi:hypothetical protein